MAAVASATDVDVGDRVIAGQGTPESAWQAWEGLHQLGRVDLSGLVPPNGRAVVVAPHPDDEVLGCGGALSSLTDDGRRACLVAATDGEASHPGSIQWTVDRLSRTRCDESAASWSLLTGGVVPQQCVRLGLPDGGLMRSRTRLTAHLQALLQPGDVLFTTWRLDGHPDHEASGRACAAAAAHTGCALVEMPVWMWHWAAPGDARVPWHRLRRFELSAHALDRKHQAIAQHHSQLRFTEDGLPPVLPPWALARVLRPFECFFLTPAGAKGPA